MREEKQNAWTPGDIAICGICGRRLVKVKTRYGDRYVCKRPKCLGTGIGDDELRELALEYVERACSEEMQKAVQEAMEQSRLAANAELERTRAKRVALEEQIGALEKQIQKKRKKMEALRETEEEIAQGGYPDANAYFKTWNDNRLAMDVNWKVRDEMMRAYILLIEVTSERLCFTSTFNLWMERQKEGKPVRADGFERTEEAYDRIQSGTGREGR